MAIKGLTDPERRRLPRLGKIHLGIKKSKQVGDKTVEYPSAVNYFVFPTGDETIYKALVNTFGEQPKALRIRIPIDDEDKWSSTFYRAYSASRGLICKGDGETALCMVDKQTGEMANHLSKEVEMRTVTCLGKECPGYKEICRPVMNLMFCLPEIPGIGVWQIDTGSINSIRNIYDTASLIKQIYGHIYNVPLLLTLEPQEVQDENGKKKTVHILHLRTNETLIQMMETSKKAPFQITTGDEELPIPDDEPPELIMPQNQEERVTAAAEGKEQPQSGPPIHKEESAKTTAKKTIRKSGTTTSQEPVKTGDAGATGNEPSKNTAGSGAGTAADTATATPGDAGHADSASEKSAKQKSEATAATQQQHADPEATKEEKKAIIDRYRAKGLKDDAIRDKFKSVTGKSKGWLKSDITKLQQDIDKLNGGKTQDQLADDLLKEMGG